MVFTLDEYNRANVVKKIGKMVIRVIIINKVNVFINVRPDHNNEMNCISSF